MITHDHPELWDLGAQIDTCCGLMMGCCYVEVEVDDLENLAKATEVTKQILDRECEKLRYYEDGDVVDACNVWVGSHR